MKKKILILGSTGMLGHQVVNYFLNFDEFIVSDISYRNKLRTETLIIDAMKQAALTDAIIQIKPDFIVNCIGILVNGSKNTESAVYLNAYLPHQLKRITKEIGAKLIHISTDCVFSGNSKNYTEGAHRDGQGAYSQTKILGEIIDDKNLTLRTSIIGPELKNSGEGLFHWFMQQTDDISGFTQSIWSGVTTIELSKAIKWSIDRNVTGLYHITNNSSINKYDLIQLFQKYIKKDISIKPVSGKSINKSFIDTRMLIDYEIPSYDQMIHNMVDSMVNNKLLYPQYRI
jgi:dTDP-4-dehydrorhamnose reductase